VVRLWWSRLTTSSSWSHRTRTLERSNVGTSRRWDLVTSRSSLWRAARLALWAVALVAYFGPWIARQPVSAALAWNAYDLFDLLRFLPEIETSALTVNLQTLRLPLVGLAVLLPLLVADRVIGVRIAGALFGCAMAALTLPPYPQILTAWRTPGWRVPFWWAVGAWACALASLWLAPRTRRVRRWLILAIIQVAVVPPVVTLTRLLPALRNLHAAEVRLGWGFWTCTGALTALGLTMWLPTLGAEGGRMADQVQNHASDDLMHIREVKVKYEAQLMEKANVVAVGVGVPIVDGRPKGKPGIIVSVTHKVAASELTARDIVPQALEDVRVWVEDIDRPHAEGATLRDDDTPA